MVGDLLINAKKKFMNYNFLHSFLKTIVRGLLLVGPMAIHFLPATWMSITLGGLLVLFFDWLKAFYATL